MQKRSDFHFSYPANIHELDLATMVNLFRSRGEPTHAQAGQYFACAVTHQLIKEGKAWFGLYYSQKAWDQLLTKGSEGFPLTEAELNVLGRVYINDEEPLHREEVERFAGVNDKLAYLIVNDLRAFGFLIENESGFLTLTPRGEKALNGITRRIYEKRFMPEMLAGITEPQIPPMEQAIKKDSDQRSLF